MPQDNKNHWYRVIGIAALFAAVLIGGTWLALKAIPDPETKTPLDIPQNEPAPIPADPRSIRYDRNGFHPTQLEVKITDPLGCLISIQNATSKPLTVRVGPHNPSGEDPGSQYSPIAPGETEIFDVRYTVLGGITLHDHENPDREIAVTYGEGCR